MIFCLYQATSRRSLFLIWQRDLHIRVCMCTWLCLRLEVWKNMDSLCICVSLWSHIFHPVFQVAVNDQRMASKPSFQCCEKPVVRRYLAITF